MDEFQWGILVCAIGAARKKQGKFPPPTHADARSRSVPKNVSAQERFDRGMAEGPRLALSVRNSGSELPEIRFPRDFMGEIPGFLFPAGRNFSRRSEIELAPNDFLRPGIAMGSSSAGRDVSTTRETQKYWKRIRIFLTSRL